MQTNLQTSKRNLKGFISTSVLPVVYFDQLLGAASTQKLFETLFLSCFLPFLFNIFKKFIFTTSNGCLDGSEFFFVYVGPLKEDIFSGHLSPVFSVITHITITNFLLRPLKADCLPVLWHVGVFSWFQMRNQWKKFKMNKKGWKWLKKSISTSFRVRAAPESW